MIALESSVFREDGLLSTRIDDRLVLMDVQGGEFISLDQVGTDIWGRIDPARSISDLCDDLARDYGAPVETVRNDVRLFLAKLLEKGVVRLSF